MLALMVSEINAMAMPGVDNPDGFETQAYTPGLDIYVNQSAAPAQLAGSGAPAQTWEIHRYILLPNSVDLKDWIIYDKSATFVIGGFGGDVNNHFTLPKLGIIINAKATTATETGLTSFTGRSTDGVTKVDANERVGQIDATTIDATYDHFSGTSNIDDVEANYTVPENEISSGVAYEAGDSKTINDYGQDIVDAEGKSLYNVVNASMIGYAFGNQDDLQSTVWNFDETSAAAPGQGISIIKRARIWMKSKRVIKNVNNGFLGISRSSRSDDLNVFKKISIAPSTLGGRPSNAKYFFSKLIPTGHYSTSKVGTASVFKTYTGRLTGLVQVLLLGGTVALIYWYWKNKK